MSWTKIARNGLIAIAILVVLGYSLLFTRIGNSVMSSYVEFLLNTDPKVPIRVEKFTMTTDNVNLQLKVSDLIDTTLDGKFSLLNGKFEGDYNMRIDDLSRIKLDELKQAKAKGTFETKGVVSKNSDGQYVLKGKSTLYGGDLSYEAFLDGSELKKIDFVFDKLRLASMLRQSGQVALADADISITGSIKNATMGQLDGDVKTVVSNGKLNSYMMQKMYGKEVPKDFTFSVDIVSILSKNSATSKVEILNNFMKLTSPDFSIDFQDESLSGTYKLDILDIQQLIDTKMAKIKGGFSTSGKVSGTMSNALIEGVSDLFGSDTSYAIGLERDEVASIQAKLNGLSLAKMAETSGQKSSIDGKLNVTVDIKNAKVGELDGLITSELKDVKLDKKLMKKEYDVEIPKEFNLLAKNEVKLIKDEAIINSNLQTPIASLHVNELVYNLKDQSSKGFYTLKSSTMKELVGLSGLAQKLPREIAQNSDNAIEIKGTIQGGKNPKIDGKTDFMNGELNFVYEDELLSINLLNSGLKLKKENKVVYESNANAKVNYDTKTQKVDMVLSFLQSGAALHVRESAFDMAQNTMYALVDFEAGDKKLHIKAEGDMDNPDITLKAQKPLLSEKYVNFMKNEINKNLQEEAIKRNLYDVIDTLSKPNATLTKVDMLKVEKGVEQMVAHLKEEYSRFKNIEFTKEHFDNLQNLADKMRKEKGVLTDEDIKEVERRSKAIVEALKNEWKSDYQKEKRDQILSYFEELGKQLSSKTLVSKEEMQKHKQEFLVAIDNYQSLLLDKNRVDNEIKKYDSVIKVIQMLKKDEKFDKQKFYALLSDFHVMLDFIQHKIASTDATDEQIEVIRQIGEAIQDKAVELKKL